MADDSMMERISKMQISVPYNRLVAEKMKFAAPLSRFLSGEEAFNALRQEVDDLVQRAPADNDVLIYAFGLVVVDVHFIEPSVLVFRGFSDGQQSSVIVHFTQLVAHVIYRAKTGPERIVTGFSPIETQTEDSA